MSHSQQSKQHHAKKKLQQHSIATPETVEAGVRTAAAAALHGAGLKGCENRLVAELGVAATVSHGVMTHFTKFGVVVKDSDKRKYDHIHFPEGAPLTRPRGHQPIVEVVLDVLEGLSELIRTGHRRRGCMTLFALVPKGGVPKLNTNCRARTLGVPPGSGEMTLDDEPAEVVHQLCAAHGVTPGQVHPTLLARPWNKDRADAYRAAGATVTEVPNGSFQELVEACSPVEPGGPVRVFDGISGMVEALLAAVSARTTGGSLFMQPIPEGKEMRSDCPGTRVYTAEQLIRSDDSVLFAAGVTDPDTGESLVPGVRHSPATDTSWVSVLVAAPSESRLRVHVAEFAGRDYQGMTPLDGVTLDEHLMLRYLGEAEAIESRLAECGDVEYFQNSLPVVPGLEHLGEKGLISLLRKLVRAGRVGCTEEVTEWDSSEYRVTWTSLATAGGEVGGG